MSCGRYKRLANKTDQCIFGCKTMHPLHSFPDPKLNFNIFMKWKKALKHVIPEDNPYIIFKKYKVCHNHFTKEMKCYRNLFRTAVPSVNIEGSHLTDLRNETQRDKTETLQNNSESQPIYFRKGMEANDYSALIIYSDTDDELFDEDNLGGEKELTDVIEDLMCGICGGCIRRGFRYSCLQCVDVDLCGGCEAKGYHRMHYVLRPPFNANAYIITEMIRIVRQALLTDSIIDISNKDSVEDEFTEEVVDEPGLETNENSDPLSITERIEETEMQQNSSINEATASTDEPPAKKTKKSQKLVLNSNSQILVSDSDPQKLDSEHSDSQKLSLDIESNLPQFVLKKSTQEPNNKDTFREVSSIATNSVNPQFVLKKSTQNLNNKDTFREVPSIATNSVNTQVKPMKTYSKQNRAHT